MFAAAHAEAQRQLARRTEDLEQARGRRERIEAAFKQRALDNHEPGAQAAGGGEP